MACKEFTNLYFISFEIVFEFSTKFLWKNNNKWVYELKSDVIDDLHQLLKFTVQKFKIYANNGGFCVHNESGTNLYHGALGSGTLRLFTTSLPHTRRNITKIWPNTKVHFIFCRLTNARKKNMNEHPKLG